MEDWKSNEKLLLEEAVWLVGKPLKCVEIEVRDLDKTSRKKIKAGVGYVIERYFRIDKNSDGRPDFPELGIELKTIPLKRRKDGSITIKEPLSLNMIDYEKEYEANDRGKNIDIRKSSFYKKNKKILFVCYLHEGRNMSDYIIKYVFIWEMNNKVLSDFEEDYKRIITKISKGEATDLHQKYDRFLTTCPKHNGKFNPPHSEEKFKMARRKQPVNSKVWAEKKAFRIKNNYMSRIIADSVGIPESKRSAKDTISWFD